MDNPHPATPPSASTPNRGHGSADPSQMPSNAPSMSSAADSNPDAPASSRPGLIPLPPQTPQRSGFNPANGGSQPASTPQAPMQRAPVPKPVTSAPQSRGFSTPMPEHPPKPPAPTVDPNRPLPVAEASGPTGLGGKITAFGGQQKRHEDSWVRTPNTTGSGAIHVKTFHCKLTDDALTYLDLSINEWLDAHPQYEVKFVSSSIGILTGKLKEPALICQVWV